MPRCLAIIRKASLMSVITGTYGFRAGEVPAAGASADSWA
jgi:hypothetical protein